MKEISPCGAVCADCARHPDLCGGCAEIEGRVWWLQYTGADRCAVYACVKQKGRKSCGGCAFLPCERFTSDPTISEEQNAENLRKMLKNLEING